MLPAPLSNLSNLTLKQEIRTTTTNDSGVYQFLEIEPGTYEVVITATGFNETRLKEAALEPNRVLRLDARLTVGGATEEVTVTAAQEILDRETPTIGTTVEGRRVEGLPLNGRNILDLALGQPGVTPIAVAPGGTGTAPFGAGLGIRSNGQRGTENNITLDGANNNETAVGGSTGFQPRPDCGAGVPPADFKLRSRVWPQHWFGHHGCDQERRQ